MAQRRTLITGIGLGAAGLLLAWIILTSRPAPEPASVPEQAVPAVAVQVAQPAPQRLEVRTQGTVEPLREIALVSQVAGRIAEVSGSYEAGGFFAAGEALVTVEDIDYQLALTRAEAALAAAEQRLAEEEGRARQARREWRDLGSDSANDLFLRKPQLASAAASVRAAEADVARARLDLERTRVSAPFAGRVREKLVDLGQYVTVGTPIARVYATEKVQVRLPLTERQVALLDLPLGSMNDFAAAKSPAVTVSARFGGRDWSWQGRVVRTDAAVDIDTQMLHAVVEVDRPFEAEPGSSRPPLAPGLFVHAVIQGRDLGNLVELPRHALRRERELMLVGDNDAVEPAVVEVVHTTPTRVWVRGLAAGDQVVVDERRLVVAGMQVEPRITEMVAGGASVP